MHKILGALTGALKIRGKNMAYNEPLRKEQFMLIVALMTIIVLLVMTVLNQRMTVRRMNKKHALELRAMEDKTFDAAFKSGWNSLLNDYGTMRTAIRELENKFKS
jgi:hypothetical protein